MTKNYRKLWVQQFGSIPIDENGFTYEIHHKDGNHKNNEIQNLQCVPIQEHLDIHLKQKDWFAAALIGKRIGLGPTYMSDIQKGKKRPGIGGAKKGRIPWNKNKKGCFSQKTIDQFKTVRKGRRFGPLKITDEQAKQILEDYNSNPKVSQSNLVGTVRRNGKKYTYENAFCADYAIKFKVTSKQIYHIITGVRNVI